MSNDVFAVVADPTRRRILEAVVPGPRPVNDVVSEMGVSQPTVSKHLKVLREAGLVRVTAQGQRRLYAGEPGPLRELVSWVEELQRISAAAAAAGQEPESDPAEADPSATAQPAAPRAQDAAVAPAPAETASTEDASTAAARSDAAHDRDAPAGDLAEEDAPAEGTATEHSSADPGAAARQEGSREEPSWQAEPRQRRTHHVDLTPLEPFPTNDPAPEGDPVQTAPASGPESEEPGTGTAAEPPQVLDPLAVRPRDDAKEGSAEPSARPSRFLANLWGRRRGR